MRKTIPSAPTLSAAVSSECPELPGYFRPTKQTTNMEFPVSEKDSILVWHCVSFLLAKAVGNTSHICKNAF